MGADTYTVRLNGETETGLETMAEDMDGSAADAHRKALRRGLEWYGYVDDNGQTQLKTTSIELSRASLYTACALIAIGLVSAAPLLWTWAVMLSVAGLLLTAVSLREPGLTHTYRRLLH